MAGPWHFDASGDGYERLMGRWSRRLAEPFLDFVGTTDGEHVLDVGCGTGNLARAIVARSANSTVQAFDLAPSYIAHAIEHGAHPRIAYDVGNACAMELADRTFDRVLSLLVLHFVPRADVAIAEMTRVAKPGAVVGAAVWDARGGFVANRLFFDTAAALDPVAGEHRARNYTRPMTHPGDLGRAWHAAGLVDVVETALAIRMEFADFADYWAPYAGRDGPGAAYVATLDAARVATLRDHVRAAYLDGEDDGPRSYAATAWAVKGRVSA